MGGKKTLGEVCEEEIGLVPHGSVAPWLWAQAPDEKFPPTPQAAILGVQGS